MLLQSESPILILHNLPLSIGLNISNNHLIIPFLVGNHKSPPSNTKHILKSLPRKILVL